MRFLGNGLIDARKDELNKKIFIAVDSLTNCSLVITIIGLRLHHLKSIAEG